VSSVLDAFSSELERIVARFGGVVRRVARRHRLSDGDVEDVLQEVRIRLWRAHSGGGGRESEQIDLVSASYVYRTAVSAAIDLLRRRRARGAELTVTLDEAEEPISDAADPTRSVEQSELATQLAQAIDAITPSRRPVLRMYLAGNSREEIAALMGWSEPKTRNLLYRGLSDLRERLTEMGIQCETTR
jgi:RNA polymerase sigma factor (sigma-70 family)